MDATEYAHAADACLKRIADWLADQEDLDLITRDGLVEIEFEDGTRYVVNRQGAARQMWLAAGARAWHYDFDPATGEWLDDRDRHRLRDRLAELVSEKLGRRLPFPG
ncbi:MAG TPA: iron donor protein CyaY [Candidatus Limnocylindria bacterium]|nr:iron donor protein CyaY [Candidatus Limnocylindria bacterium]